MSTATDPRTLHRTCPLCEATCGLTLTMTGDRVTRVTGDRDDVFSRGYICPKGAALGALHHDPDRLRAPQIREGTAWRTVDWPEAFAAVEAGLAPILAAGDRDALALYAGNPNVHGLAGMLYTPAVMRAAATRNIYSASTVDQMPKHVACGLMFGDADLIPVPDLDRTDFLVILGANPVVSNGSLATAPDWPGRLKALRARGGRLMVIDPRHTETAALADTHLAIRPGADALLLLAIAQHLVARGRADCGALATHVDHLERLPEALAPFTPMAVADACGLPAAQIVALADALTGNPRAAVSGRIGTQAAQFGTLAAYAVELVNLLTGHLDQPGGAVIPTSLHDRPTRARPFRLGRHTSRAKGYAEAKGELPAVTLVDEIETPGPGQVRALITIAGNPALSVPGGARLDRALAALDFMVSVDPYLNETTRHAHVILPPPSPLARAHYDVAFYRLAVRRIARFTPPHLDPEGPAEHEILARLALILAGAAGAPPVMIDQQIIGHLLMGAGCEMACAAKLTGDSGAERVLDALIRTGPDGDRFGERPDGWTLERLRAHPHGVDLGPHPPRLPEALPTGRIDALPDAIADDLKRLEAHMASMASNDTLRLIGRRHARTNNSWMHNLPKLAAGADRCALWMHPDDAAARGIGDGDRVELRGVEAVGVVARLTDALRPGVVSLPHGWGHDVEGTGLSVAQAHAGVNVNRVIPPAIDPLSGTAVLNGVTVEVARVSGEPVGRH